MGLDTSHDAWHGAYSRFARWRAHLAYAAGLPPLHQMYGHQDNRTPTDELIHWDVLKPDDLILLLDHSDCEGSIVPADGQRIADRLEQLLDSPRFAEDDWGERTRQFIDGLRAAVAAGEPVEFY